MICPYCERDEATARTTYQTGQPAVVALACGHEGLMDPFYAGGSRRLVRTDDEGVLAHFAAQRDGAGAHPGTHDVSRVAAVKGLVGELDEDEGDSSLDAQNDSGVEWATPDTEVFNAETVKGLAETLERHSMGGHASAEPVKRLRGATRTGLTRTADQA